MTKRMKKVWNVVVEMWRPALLALVGLFAIVFVMGWQLASLTPGLSEPEVTTYRTADALPDIINNSVNAPYKATVYVVTRILNSSLGLRITGAVLGVISVVLFFLFARKLLYGPYAIGATLLFGTSTLLLSTARLATPDIMFMAVLALAGVGYLLRFGSNHTLSWIIATIVVSLSLYVPGMVVFILIGGIWQFRYVRRSFEELRPIYISACAALLSLLLAPMVISLIREPVLWREFLGLPSQFATPLEMAKQAASALGSLFVLSPQNPIRWIGRQAALDVFATAMFIFGLMTLFRNYRLDRLWAFVGIFVLAIVFTGVTGRAEAIIMLLPFVYLTAGMGMQRLMSDWLGVFPRNPIARTAGSLLMVAAVLIASNFQLQRYFVAWPNNVQTKAAFNQQLPPTP